jgi:hypothetical protein
MSSVTREQIDRAKQVDILDYLLSHEPNNISRIGSAHYLRDHDSLRISNGLWKWESRDIGGKNVVDYLIKVRGFSFVDAVRHLAGGDAQYEHVIPIAKPPPERKPFALPSHNGDNERVIAYLQSRGIDRQLVFDCIERGSLYESAKWHNCVFVGRDDSGKARFASMRGTVGDFKRDVDGSDKRFGFAIPPKDGWSDTAIAYESPVDALSHQTMSPESNCWRLSLGCTAIVALTNFLERHSEVKSVVVCTDNDKAGNISAVKIAKLQGISVVRSLPPDDHKDWNDALILLKNDNKPSLIGRLEAAKVAAAEANNLSGREYAGITMCL